MDPLINPSSFSNCAVPHPTCSLCAPLMATKQPVHMQLHWRTASALLWFVKYVIFGFCWLWSDTQLQLSLSRQNLDNLEGSSIEKVAQGGYVLQDVENPQVILVSTGSELSLCVEAAKVRCFSFFLSFFLVTTTWIIINWWHCRRWRVKACVRVSCPCPAQSCWRADCRIPQVSAAGWRPHVVGGSCLH